MNSWSSFYFELFYLRISDNLFINMDGLNETNNIHLLQYLFYTKNCEHGK